MRWHCWKRPRGCYGDQGIAGRPGQGQGIPSAAGAAGLLGEADLLSRQEGLGQPHRDLLHAVRVRVQGASFSAECGIVNAQDGSEVRLAADAPARRAAARALHQVPQDASPESPGD